MSEVGAADRSRLLRSKRADISGIVTSRKRKLREFFAVCDTQDELPQITYTDPDAPPTTTDEAHFLDVCDILQGRLFDESNLPTRRNLRSDASKQRSISRKVTPEIYDRDGLPRKPSKSQREGSGSRQSKVSSPKPWHDKESSTASMEIVKGSTLSSEFTELKPSSKNPPSNLSKPVAPRGQVGVAAEDGFHKSAYVDHTLPKPVTLDEPNIMLGMAESALRSPLPSIDRSGYSQQSASMAEQADQDELIQQTEMVSRSKSEQSPNLSIKLPGKEASRGGQDLVSSPGSTVDAHSATTPALHEASTDTSPENESARFEPDGMETNEPAPQTPSRFKSTSSKDSVIGDRGISPKPQATTFRNETLGSSPSTADAQLRMEEEASALSKRTDNHQTGAEREVMKTSTSNRLGSTGVAIKNTTSNDSHDKASCNNQVVLETVSGKDSPANYEVLEISNSEIKEPTQPESMDIDAPPIAETQSLNESLQKDPTSSIVTDTNDEAKHSTSELSSRHEWSIPNVTPSSIERMTTRVSSGAMRHKSVSEILGEISRPNTTTHSERHYIKGVGFQESPAHIKLPSQISTQQSKNTLLRNLVEKTNERSKLSTVVFAKKTQKAISRDTVLIHSTLNPSQTAKDDYFMPLFLATASTDKRGVQPLDGLLQSAHKTITTANAFMPYNENQTIKVLKRIYSLQSTNKWSLRQPKRTPEPNRPTTHWDVFLEEAKWMRTDFREERKWRLTVAKNLAEACAAWVSASPNEKQLLQVNARSPPYDSTYDDALQAVEIQEASSLHHAQRPPVMFPSSGSDSPLDDLDGNSNIDILDATPPTALFTLQENDVVFGLRRTPNADKLLEELPLYGLSLTVPQSQLPTSNLDPDRSWRRPALPLSKYVEGQMDLKLNGPPKWTSRYNYDDEDDDVYQEAFGEPGLKRFPIPPEQSDVALFNPDNKHIRDRIHAGHQFRPPSEFPMPLQSFFECRSASQWTWAEDDELKSLVREYSYNWSLISSILTSPSLFYSGAERRTPWECFERWISLEGLPADMQKTHYFRAYNTRLETAQRNVLAQPAAPQQQNSQGQPPARRRPTTSIRVERRRNQKHLTLVDAMRKLAKKRETTIQKQQHAAGLAAMRKANEPTQARAQPVHTPQDFSRLKFEREEQNKERVAQFQQRQEAQRRAVLMQARNPNHNPQQPGVPNGPTQRAPVPPNGQMGPNPIPSGQNLVVPGQNRPRSSLPPQLGNQATPMANNLRVPQMSINGVPQAQMQGIQGQNQLPMPNPAVDNGLMNRARRVSEQQRQAIHMQQQGQIPSQSPQIHNSPPRMNGISQPFIPNSMMPSFNPNINGAPTPPANGHAVPSPGQAGSPRMGHLPQQLSSGMVPQVSNIEAQIRQKYPNATPEQVMRMLQEALAKSVHQRQGLVQSAMNAAAGGNTAGNSVGMNGGTGQRIPSGVENSPQLYAQMLRQQQERQQAANAAAQSQSQASGQAHGHQRVGSSGSSHGK